MSQFRIGTLLFVTFVVALCGSLFQQSVLLGCVATIPIAFALIRTLRQKQSSSLVVAFAHSVALLVSLACVSIVSFIVSGIAVLLLALQSTAALCGRAISVIWRKAVTHPVANIPTTLVRWTSMAAAMLVRIVQGIAVSSAIWLHETNCGLATRWRQRPSSN